MTLAQYRSHTPDPFPTRDPLIRRFNTSADVSKAERHALRVLLGTRSVGPAHSFICDQECCFPQERIPPCKGTHEATGRILPFHSPDDRSTLHFRHLGAIDRGVGAPERKVDKGRGP